MERTAMTEIEKLAKGCFKTGYPHSILGSQKKPFNCAFSGWDMIRAHLTREGDALGLPPETATALTALGDTE